jgi:aminoglycoside phosphotransferase (APT) family kinase protein
MDRYAPLPTADQLGALAEDLGQPIGFDHRVPGGLGGTIDVLGVGDGTDKIVLRRYWLPEENERNPAEGEFRALALAAEHGIPAPAPLWIDRVGLFPERAIVISYIEGKPLLGPDDQESWAEQLARVLVMIHGIRLDPADSDLFPEIGYDDHHHSGEETLEALRLHPLGPELWAKRNEAAESFELSDPVYLHHDFWPGNTLWVDQELLAVVDWEGGCVGDPALDVAYCALDMRLIDLHDAADWFVYSYRRQSGRELRNLGYWELAALCRPMGDLDLWVESWGTMGVEITVDEARRRHTSLISSALGNG